MLTKKDRDAFSFFKCEAPKPADIIFGSQPNESFCNIKRCYFKVEMEEVVTRGWALDRDHGNY